MFFLPQGPATRSQAKAGQAWTCLDLLGPAWIFYLLSSAAKFQPLGDSLCSFPHVPHCYPEKYCCFANILGSHFCKLLNTSTAGSQEGSDDSAAFGRDVIEMPSGDLAD